MTVTELYHQAQELSAKEQEELANLLLSSLKSTTTGEAWTEEELSTLMAIAPMTGAEIVASGLAGAWEHDNIPDGGTWREEQQAKRKERRKW